MSIDQAPTVQRRKRRSNARQRVLDAAYQLFSQRGIHRVGIDEIVAKSGCAKASLYDHFGSKSDLALAFLVEREKLWTRDWLEAELNRTARTPDERLLAVFDVFHGWFQVTRFEGCSFITVLLETSDGDPIHAEAAAQLAKIRSMIAHDARKAGLKQPARFAQAWHMLMKGAIVAACEGQRHAARDAKRAARVLLENWPRT